PHQDEGTIALVPSADELALTQQILLKLEGTRPMALTPSFDITLRPLAEGEPKDTPEQTHTWEILIPSPPSNGPYELGPQYGAPLYHKLSSENRIKFDELVGEYIQSGWWVRRSAEKTTPREGQPAELPLSQVFLLTKAKKPRLVIDCRPLNKLFPKSSSPSLKIWLLLLNLRMLGPPKVAFADIKSAFYRIRQDPPLVLKANELWETTRMPFGVQWGPAGLFSSGGSAIAAVEEEPAIVAMAIYLICLLFVDDLSVAGRKIGPVLRIIVILLRLMGFAIALLKFKAITSLDCDEDLAEAEIPVVRAAEILSCEVSYSKVGDTPMLTTSCQREGRLNECMAFLASQGEPSKAQMYSLAGNLSYDPLKQHPVERYVADEVRSMTAGWPEWYAPVKLEGTQKARYEAVMKWVGELGRAGLDEPTGCAHLSPLYDASELLIEGFADASLVGGGFVIYCRSKDSPESARVPLWFEAWRQKHRRWHSNRRELAAALRCVQAVVDLLQVRRDHLKPYVPSKVVLSFDNKATVQWCTSTGIDNQILMLDIILDEKEMDTHHLADRVAEGCRTVQEAATGVAYVRTVLHILKQNAEINKGERAVAGFRQSKRLKNSAKLKVVVPERGAEADTLALARTAQGARYANYEPKEADVIALRDGVAYMKVYTLSQSIEYRPIIPLRTSPRLVRLIVSEAHRATSHGSVDATAAKVHTFYVEGLREAIRSYLDKCPGCQIVHSKPRWTLAVGSHSYDMKRLIEEGLPFTVVYCDFLALGGHIKAFTTVCLATGATEWILAEAESIQGAVRAYHALLTRVGHSVKYMHVDTASYFQSDRFRDAMKSLNVTVVYAKSRSPWMQGKIEKLHDLGMRRVRSLFLKANQASPSKLTQAVLDYVTLLLNTRPVGARVNQREEVVTYDTLVRGYTRPTNPFAPPELGVKVARAVRTLIMESRWSELKLKSQKSGAVKSRKNPDNSESLEVGDLAL
ncbi:hypothetical protein FOL47_001673, partial [Perkinsus chesapeaki]